MNIKATSTPNIALIKYWGNRMNEYRLPAADSCSITLNAPTVDIEMEESDAFSVKSFNPDGTEKNMDAHLGRIQRHFELCSDCIKTLDLALPEAVSITVRSNIPAGIGLASSAAVFSGLAKAYSGFITERELTLKEVSILARLGSGSAARSIFGGYASLIAGEGDDIESSFGEQIADENHWQLHDIVIAPDETHKKVGSTEGHALAHTSPHFAERVEDIQSNRQQECVDAIANKDFEKLQKVAEEDCLDMHHVMQTSEPSIQYLSDETHRIIGEVETLRNEQHLPVLYTMDAGPTVHLICTDEAAEAIKAYAHQQSNCTVFETKVGPGSTLQ